MSDINIITAMRSSILTTSKSTASQTIATPQPEPAANDSSATISQAARDALAASVATSTAIPANSEPFFKQAMAEKFAGGNAIRAMIRNDPSDPQWAKWVDGYAEHDYTAGSDVLYDISHTMSGASGNPKIDGILRYSSGEIVTAESQTYATKQTANFQDKLREMIDSEKSKGTNSSDILLKIFDLQETQPARFRAMMMWPNAADFATNPPDTTSAGQKA
ncbi:MAG TPA: hypothetical protein VFF26_07725 [Gallionella sp.]|nr:hypothetical protein [Gallionella sp.]